MRFIERKQSLREGRSLTEVSNPTFETLKAACDEVLVDARGFSFVKAGRELLYFYGNGNVLALGKDFLKVSGGKIKMFTPFVVKYLDIASVELVDIGGYVMVDVLTKKGSNVGALLD